MKSTLMFSMFFLSLCLSSAHAESEIVPTTTDTQALLGTGYAKDLELFKGECLEGTPIPEGLDQAVLSFKQTISHDQLANELGFGASGRARFGVVSMSAAAKFLSDSKSNSFSISAIYSGDYQFKNLILSKPRLTTMAQPLISHDERWNAACGDEFVSQMKLGAKIFFNIRIDFASQADKKAFEANFNINGPLWGASGEIKTAMNQFSSRTQVTVSAFQMGGDVSELSEIFGDSQLFTQCSLGEFDKCSGVLANALNYATQRFPKKIRASTSSPGTLGGPAVLKYITKPYATAGVFSPNSPLVRQEVKASRKTLDEYLTQFYNTWALVKNILSHPSRRLSERQTQFLHDLESRLQADRIRILEASQVCYDTPTLECVNEIRKLDPNLTTGLYQLKPTDLSFENESFAQFCDEGLSPQGSESLKATLSGVMGHTKKLKPELYKPIVSGQVIDECFVTGSFLARQTELDLSNLGIVDLAPLQETSQKITRLNLSGNRIRDLSPLSSLLYGGFKHLTYLNLSRNQIKDPSALSPLSQLSRLDLRNNSRDLKCPFDRVEICLTSDLGRSGVFVTSERSSDVPRYLPVVSTIANGSHPELLILGSIGGRLFGERYTNQNGSFEPIPGPRENRYYATATPLKDGSIFVAGGTGFDTALLFHPRRRFFAPLPVTMKTPRAGHTATLLQDGRVLIAGGWTSPFNQVATQSVEIFDPQNETFKLLPRGLSVPRAHHTATLLPDGSVLILGGYNDQGSIPTADLYDPMTHSMQPLLTTRMNKGRGAHQATLLLNGKVLVTGGFDGSTALDDAELYDPVIRKFQILTSTLHIKRGGHQATLLNNGNVLITGGAEKIELNLRDETCSSCTDTAELFDPISLEFEPISSLMRTPRAFHAAAQISDGTVLVIGGVGKSAGLTADLFTYGNYLH